MELFVISGFTRIEHEKIFLKYMHTYAKGNTVYYCVTDKKKEIDYNYFKNIIFLEYNLWKDKLCKIKTSILFYDYYSDLGEFDFNGYTLITFGNYLFFRSNIGVIKFTNLKIVYVFDFFKIQLSKNEYKKLFITAENIEFIYSINYPSALEINNNKGSENYKYDIYIPLGVAINNDLLLDIIKCNPSLKFLIGPINHPEYKNTDFIISSIKKFSNVVMHNLSTSNKILEHLMISKIILFPLSEHPSDLTRIADSLANGKVIISNKIQANLHIDGLLFYDGLDDCLKKINFSLNTKLFDNINYKNRIISIYNKNHSLNHLLLELLKILQINNV